MSRNDFLDLADSVRELRGPTCLDIATSQLKIVQREWTNGRRGDGEVIETVLTTLPQKYRIRSLSSKEVASSGDRYAAEDVRVEHITPAHPGGGFTPEQLRPAGEKDVREIVYVLTGGISGDYQLIEFNTDRPFSISMVLRRVGTTP